MGADVENGYKTAVKMIITFNSTSFNATLKIFTTEAEPSDI